MKKLRRDLENFRVSFDVWFSETSLYQKDKITPSLDVLKERGYIYEKDGATGLNQQISMMIKIEF